LKTSDFLSMALISSDDSQSKANLTCKA